MQQAEPAGSIYDLGYRSYDGPRLGRRHAVLTLYWDGVRSSFGIGRGAAAKVPPMALALLALVPAAVQLGIAAAASGIVDVYSAESYYSDITIVFFLFAAAVGPDLLARDQRHRVLALYFSRPLRRRDYALAKLGAMMTALLIVLLVPQVVLFIGNGLAENDFWSYLRENADDIPPIIGSALLIAFLLGSLALVIGAQTSRRAFSTLGFLAAAVISTAVAAIVVETTEGGAGGYAILVGADQLMRGFTLWMFGISPGPASEGHDRQVWMADVPDPLYFLVALAIGAICTYLLVRRYEGMRL